VVFYRNHNIYLINMAGCVGSKRNTWIVSLSIIFLALAAAAVGISLGAFRDFFHFSRSVAGIGDYTTYLGAFQWCNDYSSLNGIFVTGSSTKCSTIDSNCGFTDTDRNDNPAFSPGMNLPNCAQFNAFRGLLVICGGLSVITIIFLLISVLCCRYAKSIRYVSLSTSVLAAITGAIAMALFIDWKTEQFDTGTSSYTYTYGISFILMIVGWSLATIGASNYMISLGFCCEDCIPEDVASS